MSRTILSQAFSRRAAALAKHCGSSFSDARIAEAAAAMLSQALSIGHVCIELIVLAQKFGQQLDMIRASLIASGIAMCINDHDLIPHLPLVIDNDDRLYLGRYYEFERRLAKTLSIRARAEFDNTSSHDSHRWNNVLSRYFGKTSGSNINWQRVAAAIACSGQLTIINGGPGTGKTTTVLGILACLLNDQPNLRIALAAPTGKAAQHMLESLAPRKNRLDKNMAAQLPTIAYTLHRLLGSTPDGCFRYHLRNPLPYDVIVVDEASMIDIELASRLVDAIAPRARLILIGDKDQLSAVDAGSVFAELNAYPCYTGERSQRIARMVGCTANKLRNEFSEYVYYSSLKYAISSSNTVGYCGMSVDRRNQWNRPTTLPNSSIAETLPIKKPINNPQYCLPTQAISLIQSSASAQAIIPEQFTESSKITTSSLIEEPKQSNLFFDVNLTDRINIYKPEPDASKSVVCLPSPVLANCVVWLQTNYRFNPDSSIGKLSSAIRNGLSEDVLGMLDKTNNCAGSYFIEDSGPILSHRSREYIIQSFTCYIDLLIGMLKRQKIEAEALFNSLNAFRVLCAVRAGPYGVDALNNWITIKLLQLARSSFSSDTQWFTGRPIIVTRNNYALGLFNGDIGLALPSNDGRLRVVFERGAGNFQSVPPEMLSSHDTAFALTVHKSQGSEFKRVALVLPPTYSQTLSRELIYTAVTRARTQIAIIGTRSIIERAISTPTRRNTGLSARLRYAAVHNN
ncbi:AAA family ATPase [Candidatus Vallotia lariciata]|uniref:AAA family ATPase n=1 Tax=Candidatus Vallotia laricis TaxID=2018052 RepID=UPI001D010221|nr:AAA family ATPase [Candidatus Vallotia lariciata]UDG82655.1 exodeoxyribonuclease V alpha subunit [Candidatus Vallotia lariciata]